jgi:hypothetical protein
VGAARLLSSRNVLARSETKGHGLIARQRVFGTTTHESWRRRTRGSAPGGRAHPARGGFSCRTWNTGTRHLVPGESLPCPRHQHPGRHRSRLLLTFLRHAFASFTSSISGHAFPGTPCSQTLAGPSRPHEPRDEQGGASHRSSLPQQVWPGRRSPVFLRSDGAERSRSRSELPQRPHRSVRGSSEALARTS